jgi:glycosyltransferase involved in cell wall biosynthesis
MNQPFFSVIIPVYNRSVFIKPAIESVVAQNISDWELIIVDDASTDDTVEVVKQYCSADHRIQLIRQPFNQERGAARNKGIENSKGKYICFLDSDDAFCPNHLQTFYDFIIKNPESAMLFSNSYLVAGTAEMVEKVVPKLDNQNIFKYLLVYTPNPARVCIEKSILNEYRFDPSIPGLEDIDLWLRIAAKYPVKHIQKYTNIYVVHEESYTLGDTKRFEKELNNFKTIFAKSELKKRLPFWGKNRLLSMCHYHLAIKKEFEKKFCKMYAEIFKSFILCPSGYNKRTNKIILVMFVYHIPIVGNVFKGITRMLKRL